MERPLTEFYEFGNFRFHPTERYLLHHGEPIQLTPKAFDTLIALVSHSGHLVTKADLLEQVWQDAFVEEATVVQNISTLRKVLSRDGAENKFIETVPKRGYRFVATVRTCNDAFSHGNGGALTSGVTSFNGNGNGAGKPGEQLEAANALLRGPVAAASSELFEPPHKTISWKSAGYTALGLFLITVGILFARSVSQKPLNTDRSAPFDKMSLARLTQTGKARSSAISPDGKYVAYVGRDAGKESLWIRQVSAPNDAQIVPPGEVRFLDLTFSNEGSDVFFVTYEKGTNEGILYRVPVIGGAPQRILNDIDSPVTFSPDGKQLAFVRGYPVSKESALIVTNADGTNEQKLTSRVFPAFVSSEGPAWSPDGLVIAFGVRSPGPLGISETVMGVETASRKEIRLTEQRWAEVGRLSWQKGSDRIILTAAHERGPHQLWQISRPSGVTHRITNDLTDYRGVSLTSGVSALSTVGIEANSSIWVTSGPQYRASELAATRNDGLEGIAWTRAGRLVFSSRIGLQSDIWTSDADGRRKEAITNDNRRDFAPAVTPDGRFLIYSSAEEGSPAKIWRTNIDGSNPKQLTFGNDDRFPSCSLDGKWILYSSVNHNDQQDTYDEVLWKVSIDGGESSVFVNQPSTRPIVSPDGKLIAFSYRRQPDLAWAVRVISYSSGAVVKDLATALPPRANIQWTPDGRSLSYIETQEGVSNIWSLSLEGGAPKQLTHFDSGQIFRYAWSVDGKQLAIVRGALNGDVILIRDFG